MRAVAGSPMCVCERERVSEAWRWAEDQAGRANPRVMFKVRCSLSVL